MGATKLCLLLLVGTCALAQRDMGNVEGQSPTCLLAKRFKNFKRFVYDYEAETLNGVNGATHLKNGPKISCKVEMDVPQTCSFILRTKECSLSEVMGFDAENTPMFELAASAEAFKVAMAKNPLKIMVVGQQDVQLFPEEDEPTNILNVKRGIISALMVPALEEEKNNIMATVHGFCETEYLVNSRADIATNVRVNRDLSKCDAFAAKKEHTSPLALISGMHYPLAKMISSSQTCNYKFDNLKKHMTFGTCTEKHILLPFSHENEYGVSTLVKQTLSLRESNKINDRIFDHNEANIKFLPLEAAEDKAPVQTKDAVMATMRTLSTLAQTNQGHQRASIFQRLVSELRGLEADVLSPAALEMLDVSTSLTWQALVQCGTPQCTSALLTTLRTFNTSAMEVDATVYALGLLPNPTRLMVKDMLAMAEYKQSKPIMFALSNTVRNLFNTEDKVTPEITAASKFLASILGPDCSGEKELTFLTLRVIGNMGKAMEAADPAIKGTLLKCMRQPTTTLSVQLAAIQAFRRMSITDEVRSNLQRVSLYAKGAMQKRLAAYLILMRRPETSDLEMVKKILKQEQNTQVKAFVSSHIYNIISSSDPVTHRLGKQITEILKNSDTTTHTDYTTMSRNYKTKMAAKYLEANVEGNVLFDPSSQLPREVLLEYTLEAFGYTVNKWEIGMEGKGFQPTIEALFGKNGFFPDTISKALYWTGDKMPTEMNEVLKKWAFPKADGQKPQVPENLMGEIVRNFNKLLKDLRTNDSPEATAYLRIMDNELGYIKASELKSILEYTLMYTEILAYIFPKEAMKKLMSNTDNELFAHYIFMDNKFSLSTASGFPLNLALSGTFAPGAKGGLRITPNMQEVSFMPSMGVGFVTKMGVKIPEFVASAVEMHTNMYHQSALNAKLTMEQSQIKLSIPAPQGPTQLFSISNRVVLVNNGHAQLPPEMAESRTNVNCSPLFSGVNFCATTRFPVVSTDAAAPYFPLNGKSKFALEIQPTGDITEYTVTMAYKLLSEGKEGRHKVDSLKMLLRAEGVDPTEASIMMKYNRNRNVFTTNVQIPDLDVETGIKVGMADSSSKGKSITLDITNKNIPRVSLIGRARIQDKTDAMVQVQLLVPSLKTDAAITATMNTAEGLSVEIKSDIKLPETSSIQSVIFKYGEDQAEVGLMSDMTSDIKALMPYTEPVQKWVNELAMDVMDQKVVKTDMKIGHIFSKALEASNIWVDKIASDVPYAHTLRNSMAELEMPTMPENLFMKSESKFRYQFNKDRMTITIPLPLGGKSSQELRIPPMLTTPRLSVPQVALELASKEIKIPTFTIPADYQLMVPLMGMVEVSAKVQSNYYNWEGMASAGNNTKDSLSYLAKFKAMANSPIELLSFKSEGAAGIGDTSEEIMKVTLDGSLEHKLMETTVGVLETIAITDKVLSTSSYKFKAFSPLGLQTSLDMTSQFSLATDMLTGDANMNGSVTVGSMSASTTYTQSFSAERMKKEAKTESTLRVNSPMIEVVNKAKAVYANEELQIQSNTNMEMNPIKHTTKVTFGYKDAMLTFQTDSVTKANEKMIHSQVAITASRAGAIIRVENQAEDGVNRGYSLVSGSMNPSGMEINTDASVNIFASHSTHKSTVTLNMNGLTTSCTTTAQRSPMTFESVFDGGVNTSGATMSINAKVAAHANTAEMNFDGKVGNSEVSLNSIFKGSLFDANTRNRVNIRVSEDGLTFSNNLVGSFSEIKTDSSHSLALTLRSLALSSKTENFFNERNSYKHDFAVDMKPFIVSVNVKNDLKILDVNFVNEARLQAKPYMMELTGTTTGIMSEEELKHTYEITFVDMILSSKYNTNGKLLGSQITHTSDVEIDGLTMKFNNMAKLNAPSLQLESTVKTTAAPFILNVDANFKSNGAIYLYGQQTGDMYSKFLLKASPLAFMHSFEHRASTTHELENGASIKTSINNMFNSMMTPNEQSVMLKVNSKINNHALDQEMAAYNNAEKMGVELKGALSTTLFNRASENHDYSVSGFVKYDKNSDSHFIQIPFIEKLPAVIEEVKTSVVRLVDRSIDMLKDFDTKYEISAKVHAKVKELKEVIDKFDLKLFIQDLKDFIKSMENQISRLMAHFPTKEVIKMLKSVKETVRAWMQKHGIAMKINVILKKIEEILDEYKVEEMIEKIVDEVIVIMKQYRIREKIQSALAAVKSIDVQPTLNRIMAPARELVNQLYAIDYKQIMDNMRVHLIRMVEQIKSFDYESFALELKEEVVEMSKIPCFGKLYGEFRMVSPNYSLRTTADLENTTTTSATPQFTMNLNSQATSTCDLLAHTLDASVYVAVPERSHLTFNENIKAVHKAFTLDHQGTMSLFGLTARANARTIAKATTEPYVAELVSDAVFAMESGISTSVNTTYKHEVNMPLIGIFTEAYANQKAFANLEAGVLSVIVNNKGKEKYRIQEYSDEATHKSDMDVALDLYTLKATFTGATACSHLKMNQNVKADISFLRHVVIDAKAETETPFIKNSVAELKFQAKVEDLNVDVTASHNAELLGLVDGTLSNTLLALVSPSELMFDAKNKGNVKVTLPFKLIGKMDLQNDVVITVKSDVQQARWTGLARFNQYKYSHSFTADNGEREIHFFTRINGEANLEVLKTPVTIPEISVPLFGLMNNKIEDYSLWEDTGLSKLLTTTQQTFDMDAKFKYTKNPEMITIDIDMEPIFQTINTNVNILHTNLLIGKDKAVATLANSYVQAKAKYEKYNIEMPKTITVPAYKVPVVNVEVSSFTVPMPDFSLITMPALQVPSALTKFTLPKITLPKMPRNIIIPALGDLTYEFSMKTAVITLKTDASIINQGDIIIRFDASSSSQLEVLASNIVGTTTLNRVNGFELASLLSVKHVMVEGTHNSTISLHNGAMDASITNSAKVNLPVLRMEMNQEIYGNPQQGLIVSVSSPSAGHVGLQLQTKLPAQVRGRLYGRYLSEPSNDVEILAMKMSVMNSEKINVQTTWNMEVPYEMMLSLKRRMPTVSFIQEMVSTPIGNTYNEISKLAGNLEGSFEQGQIMFKRAADNFKALDISKVTTRFSDSAIVILRGYQKNIKNFLDAAIKFLRETKFQIPGFEKKMSGLEVYHEVSTFVASVSEEALIKVPRYFASIFETAINYVRGLEFSVPGSGHIVKGKEILDDLLIALRKIQGQVIVIVKKLGDIQIEDISNRLSKLMNVVVKKAEELSDSLNSQNVERLSTWVRNVFADVIGSPALTDVMMHVDEARRIAIEYMKLVSDKFQDIFDDISIEQLHADIRAWIDLLVKQLNIFHNNVIEFLKENTKKVEPFVRVSDREMNIDIPLPLMYN